MTSIRTSSNQPGPLKRLAGSDVHPCQAGATSEVNLKGMRSYWLTEHSFTLKEAGR